MSAKTMASSGLQWIGPPDPGQRSQRSAAPPSDRPRPRIKPEAAAIAENNRRGSVGLLFQPEAKPAPVYKRPDPKDHGRENVRRIREIQEASRRRQKAAGGPVRAVYKPSKYEDVESKIAQQIRAPSATAAAGRLQSDFHATQTVPSRRTPPPEVQPLDLSKCDIEPSEERHAGSVAAPRRSSASRPLTAPRQGRQPGPADWERGGVQRMRPRSASLPRRAEHGSSPAQTSGRNFLAENARRASSAQLRRSPSAEHLQVLGARRAQEMDSYRRGSLPAYLVKRQEQWRRDEEERIANRPDPRCPPGHVPLPAPERLQTLQKLKENHEQLTKQLQSLPIRADTLRVKTRKAELEQTLSEMEEAIKIFSRPRVYVRE